MVEERSTEDLATQIAYELAESGEKITQSSIRARLMERYGRAGGSDLLSRVAKRVNQELRDQQRKARQRPDWPNQAVVLMDLLQDEFRVQARDEFAQERLDLLAQVTRAQESEQAMRDEADRLEQIREQLHLQLSAMGAQVETLSGERDELRTAQEFLRGQLREANARVNEVQRVADERIAQAQIEAARQINEAHQQAEGRVAETELRCDKRIREVDEHLSQREEFWAQETVRQRDEIRGEITRLEKQYQLERSQKELATRSLETRIRNDQSELIALRRECALLEGKISIVTEELKEARNHEVNAVKMSRELEIWKRRARAAENHSPRGVKSDK